MPTGIYRCMIISLILLDVISVGAAIWLISVVTLRKIPIMAVVFRLWLFALLPWPGVGAFAGSAGGHGSPSLDLFKASFFSRLASSRLATLFNGTSTMYGMFWRAMTAFLSSSRIALCAL